jgi:predicted nucleic acid-binding protein
MHSVLPLKPGVTEARDPEDQQWLAAGVDVRAAGLDW